MSKVLYKRFISSVSTSSYKSSKSVPVHAMTTYRGSGGIAALICNLSNRWRWAVRLTTWTLLYPERNPSAHWIWDISDYTVFKDTLWNETVIVQLKILFCHLSGMTGGKHEESETRSAVTSKIWPRSITVLGNILNVTKKRYRS